MYPVINLASGVARVIDEIIISLYLGLVSNLKSLHAVSVTPLQSIMEILLVLVRTVPFSLC